MKGWIRRRMLRLAVVTTGLLALGAGIAYATIPDGNGVFTACRLNNVGTIRLIDPSATPASSLLNHCTSLETQISWNQGGPTGPKGPTGDKGPNGDKGAAGDKGPTGDQGATGNKGTNGDKGPQGDPGSKGPDGDKGPAGDKGLPGDKGPQGDQGPAGAASISGWEEVEGNNVIIDSGSKASAKALCSPGKKVLSGGWFSSDVIEVYLSLPWTGGSGWYIAGKNVTDHSVELSVTAICANG